ncbi:MAG: 2-succinyl-5-enolpyruvyl-6-hydroxy-3-cyclohexene-1-carboxylate synthase [Bacteroidia bacterium]
MHLKQKIYHFAAALKQRGLEDVIICPGSRNAPLIDVFTQLFKCHSIIDERSAGFVALGMALATQKGVAIICTSGTAALNFYPAVAEAFYAKVPLLILTADRPEHSIDNWEGQCIQQRDLYVPHVLSSQTICFDKHTDEESADFARGAMNQLSKSGPVHINLPFDEPLYQYFELPSTTISSQTPVKEGGKVEVLPQEFINDVKRHQKIWVLIGADVNGFDSSLFAGSVAFADVISNTETEFWAWDAILLQNQMLPEVLKPNLIISLGTYIVSKKLRNYLRSIPNLKQWHIGLNNDVKDPFCTQPQLLKVRCETAMLEVTKYENTDFYKHWIDYHQHFTKSLISNPLNSYSELQLTQSLLQQFEKNAICHLANSMPVRYASWIQRPANLKYVSNRGASGIDGCVSTALGYAKRCKQAVYLLIGDVAFFYDSNAFWQNDLPSNLKVIIYNNGGGGIFDLIDGPSSNPRSLPFQTTPHNRTAENLSKDFDLAYFSCSSNEEYQDNLPKFRASSKSAIFEIHTSNQINKKTLTTFKNTIREQ